MCLFDNNEVLGGQLFSNLRLRTKYQIWSLWLTSILNMVSQQYFTVYSKYKVVSSTLQYIQRKRGSHIVPLLININSWVLLSNNNQKHILTHDLVVWFSYDTVSHIFVDQLSSINTVLKKKAIIVFKETWFLLFVLFFLEHER